MGCIIAVTVICTETIEAKCRKDNLIKNGGNSHIGIHGDSQRSLRASIPIILDPFSERIAI